MQRRTDTSRSRSSCSALMNASSTRSALNANASAFGERVKRENGCSDLCLFLFVETNTRNGRTVLGKCVRKGIFHFLILIIQNVAKNTLQVLYYTHKQRNQCQQVRWSWRIKAGLHSGSSPKCSFPSYTSTITAAPTITHPGEKESSTRNRLGSVRS